MKLAMIGHFSSAVTKLKTKGEYKKIKDKHGKLERIGVTGTTSMLWMPFWAIDQQQSHPS